MTCLGEGTAQLIRRAAATRAPAGPVTSLKGYLASPTRMDADTPKHFVHIGKFYQQFFSFGGDDLGGLLFELVFQNNHEARIVHALELEDSVLVFDVVVDVVSYEFHVSYSVSAVSLSNIVSRPAPFYKSWTVLGTQF